jgi:beta-glucuronidase
VTGSRARTLTPVVIAALACAAALAAGCGEEESPSLAPRSAAAALTHPFVARSTPAGYVPRRGGLYYAGPDGRFLLGGRWLFRAGGAPRSGWTPAAVPGAWNPPSDSERAMQGGVVWYRKDFVLPRGRGAFNWIARFESVNYRATVWLNGHLVGRHTGAYLPFEVPLRGVRTGAVNHLVVRVDNRTGPFDLPPLKHDSQGHTLAGWWNYGGILREVYLRRVDRVDFAGVRVTPTVRCATCPAVVRYRVALRNYSPVPQTVHLAAQYGPAAARFPAGVVPAGGTRAFSASTTIPRPILWSPPHPHLYPVAITVSAATRGATPTRAGRYVLRSGIRSISVRNGRLMLNWRYLDFRAVALHEEALGAGRVPGPGDLRRAISWVKRLGATGIRAHYPLNPQTYELADRQGLLVWSEIPVYRLTDRALARSSVQRAGLSDLRQTIAANGNHPSVLLWSVGNELNQTAPRAQSGYIARAAVVAKTADPTRPVAMAVGADPGAGCGSAYRSLDVLGLNEYYGWYGKGVTPFSRLPRYLDSVRRCQPHKALVVTEFGAEANRTGPAASKGTFGFQAQFVKRHLELLAKRRWLSGVTYFALQDFPARPDWSGGNPRPNPPWHTKGLVSAAGVPKPAFYEAQRLFRATTQFPARP